MVPRENPNLQIRFCLQVSTLKWILDFLKWKYICRWGKCTSRNFCFKGDLNKQYFKVVNQLFCVRCISFKRRKGQSCLAAFLLTMAFLATAFSVHLRLCLIRVACCYWKTVRYWQKWKVLSFYILLVWYTMVAAASTTSTAVASVVV